MKNLKLMIVVAIALGAIACSKEEVKNEAEKFANETAAMTATVDGTTESFLATNYSELETTKTITVNGSSLTGQTININFLYENKGDTANYSESVTFSHGVNTNEFKYLISGDLHVNKWDISAGKMSGTFNFKYFNGTDSVFVENGVFTEVGK